VKLNIPKIESTLFDHVREKISCDFGVSLHAVSPNQLVQGVVNCFNQSPCSDPLSRVVTDREVFRAAVWAIGSIQRNWLAFLTAETKLRTLLFQYDPVSVASAVRAGALQQKDITTLLPGITQANDASSILKWATCLATNPNYYDRTIKEFAQAALQNERTLSIAELMLCLAGAIGFGDDRYPLKAPGMGFPIASEFLRNLGWNGFKPDSHIIRLFEWWELPTAVNVSQDISRLTDALEKSYKALRPSSSLTRHLRYSLLGISVTPTGYTFTEVDNRVWLLARYVERKGSESAENYLTT
jgi:hypothetical protein